jgi:hypothetical protein
LPAEQAVQALLPDNGWDLPMVHKVQKVGFIMPANDERCMVPAAHLEYVPEWK